MKVFLTYISLSLSIIAFSQNVDFKKQNFKTPKDYELALKALEDGDNAFFVGDFEKALPKYEDAQKLNPNNAVLNFKIGACYLKTGETKTSMPYFEKAKSLDPKVDPKIDFALAKSYQANGLYKKAVNAYEVYLASLTKNKKLLEEEKIRKEIDICNQELQKTASKAQEENVTTAKASEHAVNETKASSKTEAIVEKTETKPKAQNSHISTTTKHPTTTKATTANTDKYTYRIQISSTATPASKEELSRIYNGPLKISHQKIGQMHKYFIGDFESKNEAIKAKSLSGIDGAFIVQFKNGVKL